MLHGRKVRDRDIRLFGKLRQSKPCIITICVEGASHGEFGFHFLEPARTANGFGVLILIHASACKRAGEDRGSLSSPIARNLHPDTGRLHDYQHNKSPQVRSPLRISSKPPTSGRGGNGTRHRIAWNNYAIPAVPALAFEVEHKRDELISYQPWRFLEPPPRILSHADLVFNQIAIF